MILEIIEALRNKPKVFKTIILMAVILTVFVIMVLLVNIPTTRPNTLQNLDLTSQSFPTLGENSLRYFNGTAFVESDLATKTNTVLSDPARLPNLTSAHYVGDSGVLTTFDRQIYNTSVEKYITELHLGLYQKTALNSMLWYLDFSDNKFYNLSTRPIEQGTYYYNPGSQIAYFVTRYHDGVGDTTDNPPSFYLYSFNSKDKKTTRRVSLPKSVDSVESLTPCQKYDVCIVAISGDQRSLLGYGNNKLTNILSTKDIIIASNNPSKFVIADRLKVYGDISGAEGSDNIEVSVSEYDINTNQTKSLGISIQNAANILPLYSQESVTIYSNINHTKRLIAHRSPSIVLFPNISQSSSSVKSSELPFRVKSYSYADNSMLMENYDGSISYDGSGSLPFKSKSPPTELVKICATQSGGEVEYTAIHSLYTLYVKLDGTFETSVDQIGKCILKNPNDTFGYMFEVKGTDPQSGKIATD